MTGFLSFLGLKKHKKSSEYSALRQSGNIFFTMFGAVALVGAVGAASMQVMKGPVRTMSQVTKRTVAENNMIASAKLAVMAAGNQASGGDCDSDGFVEPVPYISGGGCTRSPSGGGCLPSDIGAALSDPWDTVYGYCVWDHGDASGSNNDGTCGGSSNFQSGEDVAPGDNPTKPVLAIVSAGPDRIFQTSCNAGGDYNKPGTSDDLVLAYTYGEATASSGGLWSEMTAGTAEIAKNLQVKDASDTTQLAFDTTTGNLQIGGEGSFPVVKTNNLQAYTDGGAIMMASNIALASQYLSGDGGPEGITIDASGNVTTSGDLTVTGALSAASSAITGNETVGGILEVTGNTSLSTLSTSGLATLDSASVTGNASVGGTLGVTGNTTLSTLTTTDLATLNSASVATTLGVTGNTTLSTLSTSGLATLDSASVTGNASVGGALAVTGNTTLSLLTTTDLASLESLSVTNNASIGGSLDMTGSKIISLASPTDGTDAANKAYVDNAIATGVPAAEDDPQVDDVTTAGRVCRTDGTAVQCDIDPASLGGDNLGNHTAEQDLNMANYDINSITIANYTGVTGSQPVTGGGPDSLGNHTATQNINLGPYDMVGDNRLTIDGTLASGVYDTDGAEAPYSRINADSFHTNGLGNSQIFIEGNAIDSNGTINIGMGLAGEQTAHGVALGGALNMNSGALNMNNNNITNVGAVTSSAGTIRDAAGGWVRTYGSTGWLNGTYGGGWKMTDSTWIRSHGSKDVYVDQMLRADGGLQVGASGANFNVTSAGAVTTGAGVTTGGNLNVNGDINLNSPSGSSTFNITPTVDNGNATVRYYTRVNQNNFWVTRAGGLSSTRPNYFDIIYNNGTTNYQLVILPGGNVGISKANPVYTLDVNGSFQANGSGIFLTGLGSNRGDSTMCWESSNGKVFYTQNASGCANTSDMRLKTDIKDLNYGLNEVMKLHPVWYRWKDPEKDKVDGRMYGVLAQEVKDVLPEIVTYDKERDVYGVQYLGMLLPTVKAVQELKTEKDDEIAALDNDLKELRARVENLSAPAAGSEISGGLSMYQMFIAILLGVIALQGMFMISMFRKKAGS